VAFTLVALSGVAAQHEPWAEWLKPGRAVSLPHERGSVFL
jgi:hypothetical protein